MCFKISQKVKINEVHLANGQVSRDKFDEFLEFLTLITSMIYKDADLSLEKKVQNMINYLLGKFGL